VAISYVGGALANNGITAATTAINFTLPTLQEGDLIIAFPTTNSSATLITASPSGSTLLGSPAYAGANPLAQGTTSEGWVYWKRAKAADSGAAFNFTLDGSGRCPGTLAVFRGVADQPTLIEAATSSAAATNTTQNAPAVTSVSANAWIVNLLSGRVASGTIPTITKPGTHTAPATSYCATNFTTTGANLVCGHYYLTTPGAAGSYGTYAYTFGATSTAVMFSLALTPAGIIVPASRPHRASVHRSYSY
jgi:hypothetical protein